MLQSWLGMTETTPFLISSDSGLALPPRTRQKISLALLAVGAVGLWVSDRLEERIQPSTTSQKD